jgi:hypothetical protein
VIISIKELVAGMLDELPDEEWVEVLDFIGYLHWRRDEDQSWFWTEEWQARYREAKQIWLRAGFETLMMWKRFWLN